MARRFAGRRRGRPRVQWLPTFGTGPSEPDATLAQGIVQEIALAGDGTIRFDAVAVTFDYTDSAQAEQGIYERSLQDLVGGNAYRLRRIVGKFFGSWSPGPEPNPAATPPCIDVAAGFIVCKTDDSGNPTTDFEEVNPLAQDSSEDPWIWRRRWIINTAMEAESLEGFWGSGFPNSTANYHSVADGPHIDQKTARSIDRQERLFWVVAARPFDPFGRVAYGTPGTFASLLDYRLLGSIRSASSGNRRNASR